MTLPDDPPELPDPLAYLWNWFLALHQRRGGTGFGPSRLSWSDVLAWSQLTGTRLAMWELGAIMSLDDVFLASSATPAKPETSTAPAPTSKDKPRG